MHDWYVVLLIGFECDLVGTSHSLMIIGGDDFGYWGLKEWKLFSLILIWPLVPSVEDASDF